MALGFQNENAGRVSMVNYLQVVFMFLTDIFLFGKKPFVADCIGTFLIVFFNSANSFYKTYLRNEKLGNILKKNQGKCQIIETNSKFKCIDNKEYEI